MKILISGASGLLGSAVTGVLAMRGHKVIGLVDNTEGADIVKKAGGIPLMGDLLEGGQWCEEIKSADKVISLTKPFARDADIPRVITPDVMEKAGMRFTESVTNLIKAASDGSAKGVIVTYSTLCYGDRQGKWVTDADQVDPIGYCRPLNGHFDAINKTAEDADIPLIQLYPSFVYGNGAWFAKLIDHFKAGKAMVVEPGDNYLSLVHLEDAAEFYANAAEKLDVNESLVISDDRPVKQRVLMDYISDLLDMPAAKTVSFDEYKKEIGELMAESMRSSTRASGIRAFDLLGHIPKHRSWEEGIPYTLRQMGIEPRKVELEEAA